MFYSHDILTSHQYGVATIWQAATVNTKACMSRKAISEVDIDRAVKKILNPGVPLALRLQSNLLFGVSRVYYQKCHYVLDDATRVTHKLRVAYSDNSKDHQVNPNAVKAARHQIVLEDDPAFIWNTISAPDFTWQEPLLKTSLDLSQRDSMRTSSHMSPISSTPASERRAGSRNGSRNGSIFLDVGQSPDRSSLVFPLNLNDSPTHKPSTIRILGDEDLVPLDDLALDLDFGEVDHQRNSHLPNELDMLEHIPLPGEEGFAAAATTAAAKKPTVDGEGDVVMLEDEALVIPEENPLPDADAFDKPVQQGNILETTELETAAAPAVSTQKRTRSARRIDFVDEDISIPSATIKNQFQDYISAHDALIAKKRSRDCARASKLVAAGFVFAHGIGAVGAAHRAMKHPLATSFSGVAFLAALVDPSIPPTMPHDLLPGARSDQDILMELDIEDARRMPNTAAQDIDTLSMQGERSRRNTPAAEDPLGSSFAPWTRAGSAVPGSAKSARSAQSKLLSPMPRSLLQDIEQLSSDIGRSGGLRGEYSEDEFALLGGIADEMSIDAGGIVQGAGGAAGEGTHRAVFDTVGAFSQLMHEVVRRRQEESRTRGSVKKMRRGHAEMVWIDFNDFANAAVVTRAEAARAFLNVLTMATKNMCKIQSEYLPAENENDLGVHIIEVGFDPATVGQREIQDIAEEE